MNDGRFEQRVPGNLPVVMRVQIRKAGRDQRSSGIDDSPGRFFTLAHFDNFAVSDRNVTGETFFSGSVTNGSAHDFHVVHGGNHRLNWITGQA